jgi:nucleoside-diphosphate-sugar epimerase
LHIRAYNSNRTFLRILHVKTIAVIGASGYVGRKLVSALLRDGTFRVKVLSRTGVADGVAPGSVELVKGDLLSPDSLLGFLEPGCIVVNLVFLWDAGEDANMAAMRNLVSACRAATISRLVHVSTAAVAGRADTNLVDEETACVPISEYGRTKLKVEALLRDESLGGLDLVMLRPTAVFGPGAEPLSMLAKDLLGGRSFRNYLKSSLFGRRRMNLVHIDNVVAAVIFVTNHANAFFGKVFIVSDDDAVSNNFLDVESALMRGFGLADYSVPRLPIPVGILRMLLLVLGRNNVNPYCNYSGQKLQGLGFHRPMSFVEGLAGYIAAYPASPHVQKKADADT